MSAGERREYRGAAAATTLDGAISAGDTTINLVDSTNWPDGSVGPFFVVADRGLAAEEKIKCISRTGNSVTVVTSPSSGRGADGTVATSHVSGAAVEHVVTADDLDKLNAHVNDLNDNHPSLLNTTRHDTTSRHALGTVIGVGTPGASAPGDSAAAGVATTAARSDHTHSREAFATPSVALGSVASAGSGTSIIRSNATIVAFDATFPTTSNVGDSAVVGTAALAARRDHKHAREAYDSPVGVGSALADGSGTSVAHANHVHDAPQHLRMSGRGTAYSGSPPGLTTGPWLTQAAKVTGTTDGSGNITVSFPVAFPTGVLVVVPGNGTSAYTQLSSATTSGFVVLCSVQSGGLVSVAGAGVSVTFPYVAYGW